MRTGMSSLPDGKLPFLAGMAYLVFASSVYSQTSATHPACDGVWIATASGGYCRVQPRAHGAEPQRSPSTSPGSSIHTGVEARPVPNVPTGGSAPITPPIPVQQQSLPTASVLSIPRDDAKRKVPDLAQKLTATHPNTNVPPVTRGPAATINTHIAPLPWDNSSVQSLQNAIQPGSATSSMPASGDPGAVDAILSGVAEGLSGQANSNDPKRQPTRARAVTPSVPQGTVMGIHWSITPIPDSATVAFSFSERCLRDSCGDGAWGADIERDSQAAIDGSAKACEASTTREGSCGTGNGGRYFVACKSGEQPKWAALAIYDDGSENLTDGEAIAYSTKPDAEEAAVSNCNHSGCHVVWSQPIDCGNEAQHAGGTYSGPYADWVHRLLGRVGSWSCPTAPPSIRAQACVRDGQVAAAVNYAWAAECYAEAGRDRDAQKSANSMMDMLKAAQSLCSNVPTTAGASGCDTLSIFPCGSLQ